jgi:hypothetical protein
MDWIDCSSTWTALDFVAFVVLPLAVGLLLGWVTPR